MQTPDFSLPLLFFAKPHIFVPGLTSREKIKAWAAGQKSAFEKKEMPSLDFTSPLFRRRLGDLCKMVVHVVHEAVVEEGCQNVKQVFVTLRGDLSRQFSINKSVILEEQVLPASFSLSVFNAPIALSNIALSLTAGYSVIIPSKETFLFALQAALAPVLSGEEESILFVYGDQEIPAEYSTLPTSGKKEPLSPEENTAFSFATLISSRQTEHCSLKMPHLIEENMQSPKHFLAALLSLENNSLGTL